MVRKRRLTTGEIVLAQEAFGASIDYARVRLGDGGARNPIAHIAFANGNPAITLGSTIYFARNYCDDFTASGKDRKGFMHEMAHVWQFQRLGMWRFLLRYAREFAAAGAKAPLMYAYRPGDTRFGAATLEAQAEMVGDYAEALWTQSTERLARLARSLAGSTLYGL